MLYVFKNGCCLYTSDDIDGNIDDNNPFVFKTDNEEEIARINKAIEIKPVVNEAGELLDLGLRLELTEEEKNAIAEVEKKEKQQSNQQLRSDIVYLAMMSDIEL